MNPPIKPSLDCILFVVRLALVRRMAFFFSFFFFLWRWIASAWVGGSLSWWQNQHKRRTPSHTKAQTTHRDTSPRFCWRWNVPAARRGGHKGGREKQCFDSTLPTSDHKQRNARFHTNISKGRSCPALFSRQRCLVVYQPPCTGTTALP